MKSLVLAELPKVRCSAPVSSLTRPEQGVFLVTAHVVVGGLGLAAATAAARVLADHHRGLAVDAQSRDASARVALVFGPDSVENSIGLRDFFWGLALSTGRSR